MVASCTSAVLSHRTSYSGMGSNGVVCTIVYGIARQAWDQTQESGSHPAPVTYALCTYKSRLKYRALGSIVIIVDVPWHS